MNDRLRKYTASTMIAKQARSRPPECELGWPPVYPGALFLAGLLGDRPCTSTELEAEHGESAHAYIMRA